MVKSVQPNSWLANRVLMGSITWSRNQGWARSGVSPRGSGDTLHHLQTESLETAKAGHMLGRDGREAGRLRLLEGGTVLRTLAGYPTDISA